ncbi:ParB/RepB/Spo0J family partition protein [Yoonia sp.]|uniref:ParB/RepB/Spo0J family partition protein n=1 Tax=Yoonia sp. TaxID=2212373 RepID=UPI00358E4A9F
MSSDPKELRVIDMPLDEIEVGNRVRMVSPSAVNIIAMSIEDLGAITSAIHVRKTRTGYRLIDGAHRYAAATKLGHTTIPTKVWECTADQAELMESDANISMAHMQPLELAVSLAARKKTYQKIHPETRQGHAGAKSRWGHKVKETEMSFSSWMADLFGVTPRHISRIIAAGDSLDAEEIRLLRDAPNKLAMSDLQTIGKIEDHKRRRRVCELMAEGKVKNAGAALRQIAPPKAKAASKEDPVEQSLNSLRDAWKRAPKVARDRFVALDVADMALELEDAWTRADADARKAFFTANAAELYDFLIVEGMIK